MDKRFFDKPGPELAVSIVSSFSSWGGGLLLMPGGSSATPLWPHLLAALAELPPEVLKKMHFGVGDERLVPLDDEQSNFNMLSREGGFFDSLKKSFPELLKESNFLPVSVGQPGDYAAEAYTRAVLEASADTGIVSIQGVGPDAHTLGVFPDHESSKRKELAFIHLAERPKDKLPGISASLPFAAAKFDLVVMIFLGEAKREAFEHYLEGDDYQEYPCRVAKHARERIILCDQEVSPEERQRI